MKNVWWSLIKICASAAKNVFNLILSKVYLYFPIRFRILFHDKYEFKVSCEMVKFL